MAGLDPVSFLRSTPPFDGLPPNLFQVASDVLEIVYQPEGAVLVERGGPPMDHLYVIRKGAVRLERDGQTLQILEEGETFGYTSLITGKATLDVTVDEDLLAYRIPSTAFNALLAYAPFAGHFATGLAERLRNSLERASVATFHTDLATPVESLVRRGPVSVASTATIGEAARVMRENDVSAVLVNAEPPGIVTDRDLRNRVLANGLGPDTPVTRIYSHPLRTMPARTAISEAWQTLLDAGVHHLPLTREDGIIGVLSSTDLLKCTAQGPVAVLRRVERMASRDSLPGYADKVAEMVSSLLVGGLEVTAIAGLVARLNDALITRILRWAEADLGGAPCAYAWMVFGSEGRMEQTLLTDQDNALVYERDTPEVRSWFAQFAERANDDLEAAGFPSCAGRYMARHWLGPFPEWHDRFRTWIDDPNPQALLQTAIFLDFRRVYGTLDLEPLDAALSSARNHRTFIAAMAKAALNFQPPPSLLLRVKSGAEVDLKLHGVSPIVFLARCYGVEAGSLERNTFERLRAAVRSGLIGDDARETISEAYRYLLGLRLRAQLRMIAGGKRASNLVRLSELSSVERSRLKEAFRAIRDWQDKAAYHYRTDLF
ncbi:MAG TPA: DUF294 nucleotidyltransferase-like domain-containing protein [Anaeromyxobacteraceae bacterium]|nr:DUF294 nucleotidyltransferase-like domain-containing protein [Anaeromyxobacteraceae bacterium]